MFSIVPGRGSISRYIYIYICIDSTEVWNVRASSTNHKTSTCRTLTIEPCCAEELQHHGNLTSMKATTWNKHQQEGLLNSQWCSIVFKNRYKQLHGFIDGSARNQQVKAGLLICYQICQSEAPIIGAVHMEEMLQIFLESTLVPEFRSMNRASLMLNGSPLKKIPL